MPLPLLPASALHRVALQGAALLAAALPGVALPGATPPGPDGEPLDFGRDVRPLLAEHCFACHGPDEAARKGGLRLDEGDEARDAGVFDGDPAELVRRIDGAEDWELMPPPEVENPLDDAAIETLRRWVEEGAPYAEHWAFSPPSASLAEPAAFLGFADVFGPRLPSDPRFVSDAPAPFDGCPYRAGYLKKHLVKHGHR